MKKQLCELESEFDAANNHPLVFAQLTSGRRKSVIWRCGECGRNWPTTVSNRLKGTGCPYCKGKLPDVGMNDFSTICADIAEEWHAWKNGELLPTGFLPNSHEEVWWRCKQGHEWKQMIYQRVNGSKCPFCSQRKAIRGKTDLATQYPELADRWSRSKNIKGPVDYFPDSTARVWWECEAGTVSGHPFGKWFFAGDVPGARKSAQLIGVNKRKTHPPAKPVVVI